jgi:hypothetical protein
VREKGDREGREIDRGKERERGESEGWGFKVRKREE